MPFLLLFLVSVSAFATGPENRAQKIPAPRVKKIPCPTLDLFKAVATQKDPACFAEALHAMDVNESDRLGDTPLHSAIRHHNKYAIAYLLRHGADLNRRNHAMQTPRELAEALGYRRLTEHLANIEFETERLMTSLEEGDLIAANSSLLRGASASTTNSRWDTPLHRAAQSNFSEIALLLIRYGAKVDARNYLGETPLHSAALRDFYDTMKVLVDAGANTSALNFRRESVLDLASVRQHPQIMRMLVKAKAKHGSREDASFNISGGEGLDVEQGPSLTR